MQMVFVDSQFSDDIERIMKGFASPLIAIGILTLIAVRRSYSGPLSDWTYFPVTSYAKKLGVGYYKISDALDWMEAEGIILGKESNNGGWDGTNRRKAKYYRYPKRDTLSTRQRSRVQSAAAKARHDDEGRVVVDLLTIDKKAFGRYSLSPIRAKDAITYEKCTKCGMYYGREAEEPTGKNPGTCWLCYAKDISQAIIDDGESRIIQRLIGDAEEWGVQEAKRFLDIVRG